MSGERDRAEELRDLLRAAGWCVQGGPVDLKIHVHAGDSDLDVAALRAPEADATGARLLVLTASAADEDVHARLLRAGVDAVLPLDAGAALVLAVAEALTRHTGSDADDETNGRPPRLSWGPISLDPTTRLATVCGSPVHLTQTEGKLLEVLLVSQGTIVPKSELLASVWGAWYGRDHLVEVHLSRLRLKIIKAGGPPVPIAVAGVGYRLN